MASKDVAVLVVGAGPTGLTLAIEMARAGLPVRIIDKNSEPAQWSQALVVQARTLEQFERYGIAEKAVAQGHPVRQALMYHRGTRIASIDTSRVHSRYPFVLFLPQSETEKLLLDHLQGLGVQVERETELMHFVDTDGGGQATLSRAGRTETVSYRWLAGCDGAHSAVRHALQVPFEGDSVGLRFFLGDLKLSGPDVPGDDLIVHLQGGDVLFIARLNDQVTRVIVAKHAQQDGTGDRMPEVADFARWLQEFHLRVTVEGAMWRAPFHVNQRKAGKYRVGHSFLAGDASHVHSPVAGQGMNTGIQDAANLAWKIAAVEGGALESLLDSYDQERGAVGEALLAATSGGLEMATASNVFAELLRDLAAKALTPLPWVQQQIADFISETAIAYRDSSIVRDDGGSGSLRAGDRMPNPDVVLADGSKTRLLAALAGPQHLLITQGLGEVAGKGVTQVGLAPEQPREVQEHLGAAAGLWLVRPDGYIGFRSARADSPALAEYAGRVGLDR